MGNTHETAPCLPAKAGWLLCVVAMIVPVATVQADPAIDTTYGQVSEVPELELVPEALERSGAVIGKISIVNGSIFDLENPAEDKFLYRLANKLHITTRPPVIEQQLLFDTGEALSAQALQESERILRSNRYIRDAQIVPTGQVDGVVDIDVITTDTWTLSPKMSFSRSGGETSSTIGLKEMNLFGTGMLIEALYESDVDRNSQVLKVVDRHIGDSWYGVKAIIENNSDGQTHYVDLAKPFYAMESTNAHGISYYDNERVDSLYDRGEVTAQFGHRSKTHEMFIGWSKGLQNGWSKRLTAGLGYDEHVFSEVDDGPVPPGVMPGDRKLFYPFVGFELVQDKYEKARNIDQIGRTEDRFLGTSVNARVGLSRANLGSDRDAWLINAGARTSFERSKNSWLLLSSEFVARWEADGIKNLALVADAKYYRRYSEKRLFVARLSGTFGHNLDLDQQLFLGGDNGLRGYPLRYQSGDKRALLTLEQRFFTDWYPFRLFHVGAAVFFDAGQTWGDGPFGTANDGLLKDVGVGLRLGNARSGLGRMIHVDIAYPLDGDESISNVQFIVELKQSF